MILTDKEHDEWMSEIMERIVNGDASQYVSDVAYLKGRLASLERDLAITNRDFGKLRQDYGVLWAFVERIAGRKYEFALDRISLIAQELLAKLAEEKAEEET